MHKTHFISLWGGWKMHFSWLPIETIVLWRVLTMLISSHPFTLSIYHILDFWCKIRFRIHIIIIQGQMHPLKKKNHRSFFWRLPLPSVGHCASSCCRREEERTSHSPPAKSLSCCELQLPFGKSSSVLLVFYAELLMMGHVLCSSVLTLGERVRAKLLLQAKLQRRLALLSVGAGQQLLNKNF